MPRSARSTNRVPRAALYAMAWACAGVGAFLAGCERSAAPDTAISRLRALGSPHLVLIVVDTLRADRLSPYGDPRSATPELARWAERGVVFERVLAQSSWTKVSMASMLTSLWPRSHGVREATDGLADRADTVAEVLRRSGYGTYAVQSNGWLEQTFGFHQGFDRYMFPRGGSSPGLKPMIWPHADKVYKEAERLIAAHDRERPFFLYLHFMDVHEYAAPPDHRRYGSDEQGAYLAALAWIDEVVGRLRGTLDREGVLDRTVMMLASDHGETFGETGVHGHARNVRTPVLRVPLLIRLPFPIEPRRVAVQVRNLDIAPTLLDLAGVPIPKGFEGESLLPLLDADAEHRPSYASLTALLYADAVLQDSVNDGVWSLTRDVGGAPRETLFDGAVDPDENVDLASIEPRQAERLRAVLDAHLGGAAQPGVALRDVRIDPALAEKLRALGYLR